MWQRSPQGRLPGYPRGKPIDPAWRLCPFCEAETGVAPPAASSGRRRRRSSTTSEDAVVALESADALLVLANGSPIGVLTRQDLLDQLGTA